MGLIDKNCPTLKVKRQPEKNQILLNRQIDDTDTDIDKDSQ